MNCLIDHQGQLVSKEQLLATVWPNVIISDAALATTIREVRQALSDNAKSPRYIETLHRRGYRFRGDVILEKPAHPDLPQEPSTAAADIPTNMARAEKKRTHGGQLIVVLALLAISGLAWLLFPYPSVPEKQPFRLPEQPSIAVLAFKNLSNDPEQVYFANGISEDLITDLSKLRGLLVIDRQSAFSYKTKAASVAQISQELGVRYVLEGSIRKFNDRVRINAQLIDSVTGNHLWAERYDRALTDIFIIQDEITQQIVTALDIALTEGEQARVWRQTTDSPEAYALFLRGREEYLRFSPDASYRAQQALEQAVAADPQFTEAWVKLGWVHETAAASGWHDASVQKAWTYARRALELDESLGDVHALLWALYSYNGDTERALKAIQRAVELNPNGAKSVAIYAFELANQGRIEPALVAMDKALRLNPNPPVWYLNVLGHIYLVAERYEDAEVVLKECRVRNPDYMSCAVRLTIAYMAADREADAKTQAKAVLRINPKFSSAEWAKMLESKLAKQRLSLLSQAGLPK